MGILERLRRYFSAPVPPAIPALPNVPTLPSGFTPAYLPFKAERIRFRGDECIDQYPHWWGGEHFRSVAEAEWARAFDRLGLPWEYEPLKFDMGPHFSYCPDFRVEGLIAPTGRDLFIEIKRFPYKKCP
jgi:hypothetical protein